jgi:hypothetical protein
VKNRQANALEAVVGWMDCMRRGDLQAVAEWFDPDVKWRGVRNVAICGNRDDVLDMLRDSLDPRSCPDDAHMQDADAEGLHGAVAVELIAADNAAVLGAKVPGLRESGGVPLDGQLYNVFRVRDGLIVEVADHALRDEALAAAGAAAPSWA